jgi:hypothetical protein
MQQEFGIDQTSPKNQKLPKQVQFGGNTGMTGMSGMTGMRENTMDMNLGSNMGGMNPMSQNPQNFYPMYMQPQMMYYNQQQGIPQSTIFYYYTDMDNNLQYPLYHQPMQNQNKGYI